MFSVRDRVDEVLAGERVQLSRPATEVLCLVVQNGGSIFLHDLSNSSQRATQVAVLERGSFHCLGIVEGSPENGWRLTGDWAARLLREEG